jgi:hypothetical protein
MCGWLALRFSGFSLPMLANPAQRNGGIVGESKIEILRDLVRTSPEFTADAYLIAVAHWLNEWRGLEFLCQQHEITFPVVLKPDTAQRGTGRLYKTYHFRGSRSIGFLQDYPMRWPNENAERPAVTHG